MSPFRNRKLLALTLAHFVIDFYSGAVPLVLAAQTAPLRLSQGQVGLVALAFNLSSALGQPLFGLLADHKRAPLLALAGVLWGAVFTGLAGLAGRFEVLLVLMAVAGLGAAAFHPPGAGGVPRVSPQEQRGGAMAVFLLGGTSGHAFGPLAAGIVLSALGPRGTLTLSLLAVVAAFPLFAALHRLHYERLYPTAGDPALPSASRRPVAWRGLLTANLILLGLVILFRQWMDISVVTYLPQHFLQQGRNVLYAGNIAFVIALGGMTGNLTAGFLSDHIGRHRVIIASLLLAAPMLVALMHAQGVWVVISAFALGFCTIASLPLTLLIGQEMLPDRPGVMTGLTLGFTFVAGGIGAAVTGALAERFTLNGVFAWLPLLPLLAAVAALGLSAIKTGKQTAAVPIGEQSC